MTEQEHLQKIKARCEALLMENQTLAKTQPCGCVVCTCDDPNQCHGCGASNCGWHPLGEIPNPVFNLTEAEAGWKATIDSIDNALNIKGCFEAAIADGLNYRIGELPRNLGSLNDIVTRHLLGAYDAAQAQINAIRAAWPVELL